MIGVGFGLLAAVAGGVPKERTGRRSARCSCATSPTATRRWTGARQAASAPLGVAARERAEAHVRRPNVAAVADRQAATGGV